MGMCRRALVDVEVTLNNVKRVVAKDMVSMFANLKLQPAIIVIKKTIFVAGKFFSKKA